MSHLRPELVSISLSFSFSNFLPDKYILLNTLKFVFGFFHDSISQISLLFFLDMKLIYSVPKTYSIKSTPISSYDSLIFSLLGDIPSFEFFPSLSNLYIKCNDSWSIYLEFYQIELKDMK